MLADTTTESARRTELHEVSDFLERSLTEPCALVIEGEAGIGKTTFWQAACERAQSSGFFVLSARPAAAEAVMAFAALADLLAGIEPGIWADLPGPQRLAMDQITLRSTDDSAGADPRTASAAFLAVIERIADDRKVVLAIDDLQWMDSSSAVVFAFAARRISVPIGIVVAGGRRNGLTPHEHRIAELAVSGMTNRDIAATLFVSVKTVEVNLSRVYRELNIRSRSQLYRALQASTLESDMD